MGDQLKALRDEIERLRRRLEQRPVLITASTPVAFNTVLIDGGNELETTQNGVVYEATVASVPSAYDPNVTSSFIDGIGRGTLFINGVAQTGYVLVVNSDNGTFRNAVIEDDVLYAGGPIPIPVDGGGAVQAYTLG
jgi:hypothetical protein